MADPVPNHVREAEPNHGVDGCAVSLAGVQLIALASGALWMPDARTLIVSDLHLGKAERNARRTGGLWPPHENADTLSRLEDEIAAQAPASLVLLGDSFDDTLCVDQLREAEKHRIERLAEATALIWITGNHDPAPPTLPGTSCAELALGPLTLRHIASRGATAEISGHYHPKAIIRVRSRSISRRCFLADTNRIILPAFGTYTGGLEVTDPAFGPLFDANANVILTGSPVLKAPLAKFRAGFR